MVPVDVGTDLIVRLVHEPDRELKPLILRLAPTLLRCGDAVR